MKRIREMKEGRKKQKRERERERGVEDERERKRERESNSEWREKVDDGAIKGNWKSSSACLPKRFSSPESFENL